MISITEALTVAVAISVGVTLFVLMLPLMVEVLVVAFCVGMLPIQAAKWVMRAVRNRFDRTRKDGAR